MLNRLKKLPRLALQEQGKITNRRGLAFTQEVEA
jgi:hypothetical protein